jgi:hypothetical protein
MFLFSFIFLQSCKYMHNFRSIKLLDSTKSGDIPNGGKKGSVSFIKKFNEPPKVPVVVGSQGQSSEGCLEKYLSCRWVVTYMCFLVNAVIPMLQNCMTMVLVCMESNYREMDHLKYNPLNVSDNFSAFQEQGVIISKVPPPQFVLFISFPISKPDSIHTVVLFYGQLPPSHITTFKRYFRNGTFAWRVTSEASFSQQSITHFRLPHW